MGLAIDDWGSGLQIAQSEATMAMTGAGLGNGFTVGTWDADKAAEPVDRDACDATAEVSMDIFVSSIEKRKWVPPTKAPTPQPTHAPTPRPTPTPTPAPTPGARDGGGRGHLRGRVRRRSHGREGCLCHGYRERRRRGPRASHDHVYLRGGRAAAG